jgi:hypothetical protein
VFSRTDQGQENTCSWYSSHIRQAFADLRRTGLRMGCKGFRERYLPEVATITGLVPPSLQHQARALNTVPCASFIFGGYCNLSNCRHWHPDNSSTITEAERRQLNERLQRVISGLQAERQSSPPVSNFG